MRWIAGAPNEVFLDITNSTRRNAVAVTVYCYFAGRKLWRAVLLDLQYKIVDSQLLGENKIVMADFALGGGCRRPCARSSADLGGLAQGTGRQIHLAYRGGDVDNPFVTMIRDVIEYLT